MKVTKCTGEGQGSCKSIGKSITKQLYLENIKDHRINKNIKSIKG